VLEAVSLLAPRSQVPSPAVWRIVSERSSILAPNVSLHSDRATARDAMREPGKVSAQPQAVTERASCLNKTAMLPGGSLSGFAESNPEAHEMDAIGRGHHETVARPGELRGLVPATTAKDLEFAAGSPCRVR